MLRAGCLAPAARARPALDGALAPGAFSARALTPPPRPAPSAPQGCTNTWMRTGKLFPGPHLFAGAAIVALWAAAAALVPAMQKGNDTARSLHIALNAVNLALFAWQVPTGLEIVGKVRAAWVCVCAWLGVRVG